MRAAIVLIFIAFGSFAHGANVRYWVEPCAREVTRCEPYDVQLADWAMQDWQRASLGALRVERVNERLKANIRIHWATADGGVYGETRAFSEDGIDGFDVYVLPDMSQSASEIALGASKDKLLRDTIVYLTCLHESGHALGLSHTDVFADVMYSFYYGGDIPEFFGRYRRKLKTQDDIQQTSGLSANDRKHLAQALGR